MRTVSEATSVRLYYLDDGGASTLFYGPLGEAITIAQQQPDEVQTRLFLQTDNEVVPFVDLDEG